MLLAAVSWPARRKTNAFPVISASGRESGGDELGLVGVEEEEVVVVVVFLRRKPMRSRPSLLLPPWVFPEAMSAFLLVESSCRYFPHSM